MSDQPKSDLKVFCRQCGGERFHSIIDQETLVTTPDMTPSTLARPHDITVAELLADHS